MKYFSSAHIVCAVFWGLCGCSLAPLARPGASSYDVRRCTPQHTAAIHAASMGWHAVLVLPTNRMRETLPIEEFIRFPYAEISWGDRDFFMSSEYSMMLALKALFASEGSVLHVVGIRARELRAHLEPLQVVKIKLSQEQIEKLEELILQSFYRDANGHVKMERESLYGTGRFYAARGKFSRSRTCNTWIADLLRGSGCDVGADSPIRVSALMQQLRSLPADEGPALLSDEPN